MKMMIVGAADKGKTTLLHQLLQEKYTGPPKANVATMGVSVKHWSYQQKQPSGSMVTYHVNCWDFAGQEEFYSTHQCFLTQRSLYVVCVVCEWVCTGLHVCVCVCVCLSSDCL